MTTDASNFIFPSDLITQVDRAPTDPGVYIMKSAQGRILYVGKARNLKKRLKSYFKRTIQTDPKTAVLLGQVANVETTVTHTEKEALILESNLIKRHRPRYNVILKDDKRYPSLRLNIQHSYPNLNIVRKIKNDGALYFGPYSSALAVKQTLKFIHKTFKLRKCHSKAFLNRTRPCLNYQMGLCLAPCCLQVNQDLYNDIVKEVIAFLKGRTPDLIRQLRQQMMRASQSLEYETAAVIRDKIQALEKTLEKQVSMSNDFTDRDVIGMAQEEALSVVTVLQVRSGYLMGSRHFKFDHTIGPLSEQMGLFLRQFYETAQAVPAEILLSEMPDDLDLVAHYLQDKKSTKVNLLIPQRGEKRRLVLMAEQNAQLELKTHLKSESNQRRLMERLQARLDLKRSPQRIECFDNSNLFGTNPVSAMVVFQDTLPLTSAYRRYKASILGQPDDYAHMMEVIRRRYGKEENGDRDLPDLLLVDGGKGQINSVLSVLRELKLAYSFDVAGIAKKDSAKGELQDKVYLAGRVNPVNFGRDTDLLLFLQRVRDEAHRFAISFQRQRRQKEAMQSKLDAISGIGPQRRVALLSRFGSVENIRSLTPEQVSTVPGINIKLAQIILNELQKDR